MAKLTGTTIPTRETKGALGDIYTDLRTGIRYKCTFAYCSTDNEYYEWKNIGKEEKSSVEDKVVKEKKAEVKDPEAVVEEPKVVVDEDEKVDIRTEIPQKKTNYTQYSATNKKNK